VVGDFVVAELLLVVDEALVVLKLFTDANKSDIGANAPVTPVTMLLSPGSLSSNESFIS
jgi:hypothetical protein